MHRSRFGRRAEQVAAIAGRVGARLGLGAPDRVRLGLAAWVYDVGNTAIDDAVLGKPGPLERHEWAIVRKHPEWGATKLLETPGLEHAAAIVRCHHERWDGRGYPDGLSGERIPLPSRIIAACDAYGAMIEDRPYRRAMPHEKAVGELRASSGRQFDPRVVDALLAVLEAGDGPDA